MSINFDMSNSRSPKLRQGLGSTIQIKAWSDDSDFIAIFHIAITPSSPCTLKTVQVLLDPTVVRPCARIWRLRSVSLFNDQRFFSNFRSFAAFDHSHSSQTFAHSMPLIIRCLRSFTAFDHSPLWTYLLFITNLLFSCHLHYCHQWQAFAAC